MATDRQVEANRRNALQSTGPRTPEGKAASRANALKHGLAGAGEVVPAGIAEEVAGREEKWFKSLGVAMAADDDRTRAEWLGRVIVTETVKLDRCRSELDALETRVARSAMLRWDDDRRLAAEELAVGLARRPGLVARQLRATLQGAELLVERWGTLADALDGPSGWDEADRSSALDLLGVHRESRRGVTRVDLPGPTAPDPVALRTHRLAVVAEEVDGLRREIEVSLASMDDYDRGVAVSRLGIVLDRSARRLHRYDAESFRRFLWATKELRSLIVPGKAESSASRPSAPPARQPASPSPSSFGPSLGRIVDSLAKGFDVPRDVALASVTRRIAEGNPRVEPEPEPARPPARQLNRRQRRAMAKLDRR